MDTRRLELLVGLARLGSMTAVAAELRTTTSTVSAQLAVLAREAGAVLVEPAGRGVRLTPAGARLAEHARGVLTALDTALADLAPAAAPRGLVRVVGFASAVRRSVLPAVRWLAEHEPAVQVTVAELEPDASLAGLAAAEADVALVFDYSLQPWQPDPSLAVRQLWSAPWGLLVPAAEPVEPLELLRRSDWVVDSRNGADEAVFRTLCAGSDHAARLLHRADDLGLVHDLVAAGFGVGMHPLDRPTSAAVRVAEIPAPGITLRCWAATRRGQEAWPPIASVLRALGR